MSGVAPPSLEISGLRKAFGPVQALDGARVRLFPGEIHALLGENGAGKSTLVSIAAGRLPKDAGTILRNGAPVSFGSPRDARRHGVALVAQHDLLSEAASVADNLALLDPDGVFLESRAARRERVRRLQERLGLGLGDADAVVATLPVGARQRIEIAGALALDPDVLMLDEPTAVLAPDERTALFSALRQRAARGKTVLLITHRLGEVFEAADRLTLLARGRTILESRVSDTDPASLVGLLVGRGPGLPPEDTGRPPAAALPLPRAGVLDVIDLVPSGSNAPPVSLRLGSGGMAVLLAIDGNGADLIASAIACVRPARGSVSIAGAPVAPGSPRSFRAAGGAFVPADRRAEGIVATMTVAENLALGSRQRRFFIRTGELEAEARPLISRFDIRAAPDSPAGSLSGGNQQKLLLARELDTLPRLLVAIHPTRGLDIASAAEVRRRIGTAREEGSAVLAVTSDPDEARAFGGAVYVVYRGEVSGPFPPDADSALLGRRMAGLAA